MKGATRTDINAYESVPAPDFDEFSIGSGEVDVSSIGGYPVRRVVVVSAGSGTLLVRTAGSGSTNRTASALSAGNELDSVQITSIRGTSDGSSVSSIRVYK